MDNSEHNKNLKTIIIGKTDVGKSTLLLRYVEGEFNPQRPTIGIDYRFKKVQYEGKTFNLQLWDSAGQERYRTIVYNYFSLSKAACIVFDLSAEDSLKDARVWIQQLVLHCGNNMPKILLGNKSDLLTKEKLEQKLVKINSEIQSLKKQYKCQFFVVSAYTGENVELAFQYLISKLCEGNEPLNESPKKKNFKLKSVLKTQKPQKKKCCD